ncbi:hypothetical protein NL676_006337 [Syzygium grande]|nr:hypothetical protein NL676_006337 [Syzygium grande]
MPNTLPGVLRANRRASRGDGQSLAAAQSRAGGPQRVGRREAETGRCSGLPGRNPEVRDQERSGGGGGGGGGCSGSRVRLYCGSEGREGRDGGGGRG